MPDLTVKIDSVCEANTHVRMTVTVNGKDHKLVMTKEEFQKPESDPEIVVKILMSSYYKELKASGMNFSQIKTAIEAKVFKL